MSLHTTWKNLQWLNQLQVTMTVKICEYTFTISVVILHSCELSAGDDSNSKITPVIRPHKVSSSPMANLQIKFFLVFIHLIETEQHYVTWRTTAAYNHQTDLVGQSVEGQLTRLWPSKIRHSKHPDTAINQPLKITNQKCWWVTNSSSFINTAVWCWSLKIRLAIFTPLPLILIGCLSGKK